MRIFIFSESLIKYLGNRYLYIFYSKILSHSDKNFKTLSVRNSSLKLKLLFHHSYKPDKCMNYLLIFQGFVEILLPFFRTKLRNGLLTADDPK